MAEQPLIAISQLAFPDTSFDQDVEIATQVGIAGISPDENKVDDGGQDAQVEKMRAAGLASAVGTPATLTILPVLEPGMPPGSPDVDERIESIATAIRRLAPFDPVSVLFITGPTGDLTEREARARVVSGIRTLAEEARKRGLRIGIEPMREANRPRWTLVCSLAETLDLLEEVGDDDVGIIFDTWHMWDSDDVHNMIGVAIDRIHGVQIADYRDPTRSSLDRVAAGQGIAGIDRLVDEFRSAGYDGWYDLEIFSDDGRFVNEFPDSLWKLDPLEYARVQVEGFMSCWS